jgi:hypothetical protein
MRTGWTAVRETLLGTGKVVCFCLVFALTANATACGGDGGDGRASGAEVEARLGSHVQALVEAGKDPDLTDWGAVRGVRCDLLAEKYRQENVFACHVEHGEGVTVEWCASVVNGELLTNNDTPELPCTAGSESGTSDG